MPFRKKAKRNSTIIGSSIRYDDVKGCYRQGKSYVNFENNGTRVYDVGNSFLKSCIVFEILSENGRILTLGNPRFSNGGTPDKGVQLLWILSRFDKKFVKNCRDYQLTHLLKRCETNCDSVCLRGISYTNEFSDTCTIHLDGRAMRDICQIMDQAPRDIYVRAADLLNIKYKGHRQNGDSVVEVSRIPPGDMEAYKIMFKEKIMKLQKVNNKEYLITKEVDDAEKIFVRTLHELSRRYDCEKVTVVNDISDSVNEILVEEQLQACNIAMNSPVSYLCGMPGTGKTSTLCAILKKSRGSIILTPSHVAKNVVYKRAINNGVDPETFSVEVTSFAFRHILEWIQGDDMGDHSPSQRSIDFMSKFKQEDGSFQVESIVIEEASMVDIFSSAHVLGQLYRIPSVKRIIFCGDHRQLPSVGKGRVLQDVMESESIPGQILKINHRSGSSLSENLGRILNSSALHITEDETFEVIDVPIEECEIENDNFGRERVMAIQSIVDLYMENYRDDKPTHIFSYTNIEMAKVNDAINTCIHGDAQETFPDGCKIKICDPDMITPPIFHRNDFLEIVANLGNKSYLVKLWTGKRVQGGDDVDDLVEIKVNGRLKEALTLGYVSSIHSFQGSECDNVIVHGINNCAYFSRDAMYTAVSRGKQKCTIVTVSTKNKNWKSILYKKAIVRLSNLSTRI